ncbi:MAG: glycoside hydrolase family 99-like domain-containing protein, partial [Lachnospiraceae bacterium]|nr:glycoside hydrolase family 99-like domain-containing protein [Lachnospiraceae bacterium]
YRSFDIKDLKEMLSCFNKWAREEGFDGIYVISGKTRDRQDDRKELIDGYYYFEPGYTLKNGLNKGKVLAYDIKVLCNSVRNRFLKNKILERRIPAKWILDPIEKRDYKENEYPGLMPDWDNTPRRGYKGLAYTGTSPERFERTLKILGEKKKTAPHDLVFVNAYNEWGEGAMIEPDEYRGYGYLEAIKRAVYEV